MFSWRVEDLSLRNSKITKRDMQGYTYIYYPIENELTIEEKRNIINEWSNGTTEYFINFNKDYIKAINDGVIKKDTWGLPKDNSAKAYIRNHDTRHMFCHMV